MVPTYKEYLNNLRKNKNTTYCISTTTMNKKEQIDKMTNELCDLHKEINMLPEKYIDSRRLVDFYPVAKIVKYESLYPKATDVRIRKIAKVIFNGPATIIIDTEGNKTVVKNQGKKDEYSRNIGWLVCLLKYILNDSKKYHDVVNNVFKAKIAYHLSSMYEVSIYDELSIAIISHIGYKDFVYCYPDCTVYDED